MTPSRASTALPRMAPISTSSAARCARRAARSAAVRRNPTLAPIDEPPFYGLELRPSLGTTSAGLLTNAHGQVLHQRRHPIAGLYASGVVAARNEIGAGYQAGINLASGMTVSYLAVQHMRLS